MSRRRPAELAESALAGIGWAVCVLGLSMAALTAPVYTSWSVQALGVPATAGLTAEDTLHLAGLVRGLVVAQQYQALPSTWRGMPAFSRDAISHLQDVRRAIASARVATGVTAGALAIWVGIGVTRRRWRALAAGMRTGGWMLLAIVVGCVAVSVLDFDAFFTAFHGLFFEAGTWQFPMDSLLIRLFPERFWVAAGASWATISALAAAVLLLGGRHVPALEGRLARPAPASSGKEGHSRIAEDV